jgi:hypothetical protein
MANNKNQHFVPRCYLKPFTKDGAGLAINLFNLTLGRAIPDAPVKNQSSRDYFYGQDPKLESANFVENSYAAVVADIFAKLGPVMPGHQVVLRRFTYLQYLRTEAQARAMADLAFAMTDIPGLEIDRPSLKDTLREAVQSAMLHYASSMKIVDDLKVCLVRNESSILFLTSDNPAVLANRWHQRDPRTKGRSFGVGKAGSIFVLPISPEVLCLLYDGDVYSVPKEAGWVTSRKVEDVRLLNEHQILNCAANLYFRDWSTRDAIAAQVGDVAPGRPKVAMEVVTAVLGETTDWGSRYDVVPKASLKPEQKALIHVLTNHPRPSGWPSFLSFRNGGKVYGNGNNTGAGFTRRWCIEQGFVSGAGYYKQPA